jgi:lysozyme
MHMTEEGLALIRRFEGFRGQAYKCPAGIWTIGYGHTEGAGPPQVAGGMTISEAEAERILAADVALFAKGVAACLRRSLSDNQFSALVSFAYNVGLANFRNSSVLAAVNAGDFAAVPRRLQLWMKGGGRVLPGLVTRRAAEAALFVSTGTQAPARVDASVIAPMPGKPAMQSTTVLAAILSALAGLASLFLSASPSVTAAPAALTGAAALWVIRERLRKSRADGI